MKIGVIFPQTEALPDAAMTKDYAQAIEGLGFNHMVGYDHVLGADITNRPDWSTTYTNDSTFYEPLVLLSYMAGVTRTIEFVTGVLILSQRQTALVAKQVSNLDILCGGRLRLGVGTGWNTVVYEALGVPFQDRGKRLDEQIDLLRALWTKRSVKFEGRFHKISEAGISPPPIQKPIPVWIGGQSAAAMSRAATKGDGWMPVLPVTEAEDQIAAFRARVKEAGRDPSTVGIENVLAYSVSRSEGQRLNRARRPDEDAAHCKVWKKAGATHVSIHAPVGVGLSYPDGHIKYFRDFMDALR